MALAKCLTKFFDDKKDLIKHFYEVFLYLYLHTLPKIGQKIPFLKDFFMGKNFFAFKQFKIEQNHSAMKVNTDACILGAFAPAVSGRSLDIGTGTGIIALMLAQKSEALIDAVEIDPETALEAQKNFQNSDWAKRLTVFGLSFQAFLEKNQQIYELVVSNPPYFQNSYKSACEQKKLARHTDSLPFEELVKGTKKILSQNGLFVFILPTTETEILLKIAFREGFFLQKKIDIHSFSHTKAHRQISFLGFENLPTLCQKFVIYEKTGVYSSQFQEMLQDYYLIF